MINLNISKFELDDPCPKINIIGKRACGKSTLIKQIVNHQLNKYTYDQLIAFSIDNLQFDNNSPCKITIKDGLNFDEEYLRNVWNKHKSRFRVSSDKKRKLLVIIDDVMFSWNKSLLLQEILFNGRCFNTTLIFSTQYCTGLPPAMRTNFDYIFACRDNNINNIKKLYYSYYGVFPTLDMFNQTFSIITVDYQWIVLNNKRHGTIEDCIFWYKKYEKCTTPKSLISLNICEFKCDEFDCKPFKNKSIVTISNRSSGNAFLIKDIVYSKMKEITDGNDLCEMVASMNIQD